jgi:7-keto-8-aminopelargonate synthetase-like enzyme
MTKELGEMGIFVTPVVAPAVSPDQTLIRTSYSATHTDEQLDKVLECFRVVGKKYGIIS